MLSFVYLANPDELPTLEQVYPLANPEGHQTVRTAVAAALLRLRPLAPIPAAQTVDGVTVYYLNFCNLYVQVLLAELSPQLANLQFTLVGKLVGPNIVEAPNEAMLTPIIMKQLTVALSTINRYVFDFLRKAYVLDELKPPPPPLEDFQALFYYQRIYFPHFDDNQFANHINVPVQTLRNWRVQAGMTQQHLRPSHIDWNQIYPGMPDAEVPRWAREEKRRKRRRS
jgi:hypothetical protein